MADPKKIYWDSCVWLRLITEADGADRCKYLIELAEKGEIQIWTSTLTLAEVYKASCGPDKLALEEGKDVAFEDFVTRPFVVRVQLDYDIGVLARKLCRTHPALKKPNDGIHLASAVFWDLDEFHSFDKDDLLCLDGKVFRSDSKLLKICIPPEVPQPSTVVEAAPKAGETAPLFATEP